jgi:hypothetical protein
LVPLKYSENYAGQRFGNLTVISSDKKTGSQVACECLCDCGNIKLIKTRNLVLGLTFSCGCGSADLTGFKFGKFTVLGKEKSAKNRALQWKCQCKCGSIRLMTSTHIKRHPPEKCSECYRSTQHANWTGYGEISGTYWRNVQIAAKFRKIEFSITIESAWELFLKQNRKCALTGEPLIFARQISGKVQPNMQTASLDRIDSEGAYFDDNIQWVHRDINKMKFDFPESKFIEWCRKVVILEDARQAGMLVDDRPVKGGAEEFLDNLTVKR